MKLFRKENKGRGVKLIKCRRDIPFVFIQFAGDNNVYKAMIDTGCEITILDSALMPSINGLETASSNNVSLNGFCGSIKYDNCIKFKCDIIMCDDTNEDISVPVSGIVSSFKSIGMDKLFKKTDVRVLVAMVIGSNTLKAINGAVDYKTHRLYIREQEE